MEKRNLKRTLLALSLAAVVTVGGTLAYLTAETNDKTNVFTVGAGLTGELREPLWDDISWGEDEPLEPGLPTLGINQAQHFAPGRVIPKNPMIKNTSEETPAYIGMTIGFEVYDLVNDKKDDADVNEDGVITLADLATFADIDWNDEYWDFNEDHTKAIYKYEVEAGENTEPLFTTVTINKDAKIDQLHNFEIILNGYLVQSEGFDNAETGLKLGYEDEFGTFVAAPVTPVE